jgi:hypothetical protein
VLSVEEEASIVNWVRQTLADGWPVGIKQLKMKVAEVTKGRPTPFTKGIPGSSWLRLFKNRHPDLMIGMPEVRQKKSYSLPSTLGLSCFYTYQSLSSFSSIEDYVCWIQVRDCLKVLACSRTQSFSGSIQQIIAILGF